MSIYIPDFTTLRQTIVNSMISAYGPDLNTNSNSPTGALIDALTNSYLQLYQLLSAVNLSQYVQQAQGQDLDSLMALNNIYRTPGTRTVVYEASLSGTPGTVIPAGSLAQTSTGDFFYSGDEVTLDGSGIGSVDFLSLEYGPVPAPSGTLNTVVTIVIGWNTIQNASDGVLGIKQISDAEFRAKLPLLINQYSLGYFGVIQAAIYRNTSVIDVFIHENDTASIDVYGTPPYSLWIFLYYIDSTEEASIANNIFNAKAAPALYSAAGPTQVTIPILDISGGSHDVTWNRATVAPLYIYVGIFVETTLTIDAVQEIKQILVNYIKEKSKITSILYFNKLLASIANVDPGVQVEDFWVSIIDPPTSADIVDIDPGFGNILTLSIDDIVVESV